MSREIKELTPQQYFDAVKDAKKKITDEELARVYDNCLELINKYKITGQNSAIKKCIFHLDSVEREREIVKMGINTFVYRDDIEYYINDVASDVVKIIELERYEREIPDEIIVFTDYTGKTERKVQIERRQKDPILFGVFLNRETRSVIDRFYYLADWVDEYCELTFDKMVNESAKSGRRNIKHIISTPQDIEELKEQINKIQKRGDVFRMVEVKTKKGFFARIQTFFSRKNEG